MLGTVILDHAFAYTDGSGACVGPKSTSCSGSTTLIDVV